MLRILGMAIMIAAAVGANARAQIVIQGGTTVPPVPGHLPRWITNQMIGDSGPANGGPPGAGITELNVTNNTGISPLCVNDAPITAAYRQTCLGSNVNGTGGLLSYAPFDGASNLPFTITTAGPLVLSSQTQNIQAKNLPPNLLGSSQVCISPTTGILSMAPAGTLCGGGVPPVQALLLNGGGYVLQNGGGRIQLN